MSGQDLATGTGVEGVTAGQGGVAGCRSEVSGTA